jgi:frataxin-like iron-binding protein CyaY
MNDIKNYGYCFYCKYFRYDEYNGEWYCATREEELMEIFRKEAKEYVEARKNE